MKRTGRTAPGKKKRRIPEHPVISNVSHRDTLDNVADIVELLKQVDLSEGLTPSARAGLFWVYGTLTDAIKHVSKDLAVNKKTAAESKAKTTI